jgi:hypothetical protein
MPFVHAYIYKADIMLARPSRSLGALTKILTSVCKKYISYFSITSFPRLRLNGLKRNEKKYMVSFLRIKLFV